MICSFLFYFFSQIYHNTQLFALCLGCYFICFVIEFALPFDCKYIKVTILSDPDVIFCILKYFILSQSFMKMHQLSPHLKQLFYFSTFQLFV